MWEPCSAVQFSSNSSAYKAPEGHNSISNIKLSVKRSPRVHQAHLQMNGPLPPAVCAAVCIQAVIVGCGNHHSAQTKGHIHAACRFQETTTAQALRTNWTPSNMHMPSPLKCVHMPITKYACISVTVPLAASHATGVLQLLSLQQLTSLPSQSSPEKPTTPSPPP